MCVFVCLHMCVFVCVCMCGLAKETACIRVFGGTGEAFCLCVFLSLCIHVRLFCVPLWLFFCLLVAVIWTLRSCFVSFRGWL